MSKRSPALYLNDILTSIRKIEEFIQGLSFADFARDEKTTEAVIRKIEIIGEAANSVPPEITDKYPEIPWEKMVSMRNKVLHEYFGVDIEILWKTITADLPKLKEQIKNLMKREKIL